MVKKDIGNPTHEEILRTAKSKLIFPSPRSEYLVIKCGSCNALSVCFSHSQTMRTCKVCSEVILKPAGGRAIINENCSIMSANEYYLNYDN